MDTASIPHPPRRLPLLGDLIGIDLRTPIQSSLKLVAGLGPISVRKFFGSEVVTVGGVELAAEVNDDSRFGKHVGLHLPPLRPLVGHGLFTAENDDPNWQLAHDILAPAFSQTAMRGYHQTMVAVISELLASWDSVAERGQSVDVNADMTRLALETIGRTAFGYRFASFERHGPHPFVAAMHRALRYSGLSTFSSLVPIRRMMVGTARQHRADIAMMQHTVDEVIDARRGGAEPATPDLLGLMLRTGHPETGYHLDAANIRDQIITFMIAGHETTAGALAFALYYLAQDPKVLARAQTEVDTVWGHTADVDPSFAEVSKLRYVRAVLDETLRLWPTAPAYMRTARTDTILAGRYSMRRGDWVQVLLPLLHRDPQFWPDPDRFDPDRFAPGQAKTRPSHAYKPFGTGQRACLGRQFAIHEAVLALGLILHRYEPVPPDNYHLQVSETLTFKPHNFRLFPRTRRHTKTAKALEDLAG